MAERVAQKQELHQEMSDSSANSDNGISKQELTKVLVQNAKKAPGIKLVNSNPDFHSSSEDEAKNSEEEEKEKETKIKKKKRRESSSTAHFQKSNRKRITEDDQDIDKQSANIFYNARKSYNPRFPPF